MNNRKKHIFAYNKLVEDVTDEKNNLYYAGCYTIFSSV
jgi:hypothetical protein